MPTSKRSVPLAHVSLVLSFLLAAAFVAGTATDTAAQLARTGFGLAGLIAATRAARATGPGTRARQAWRAVAVSFAVLVVAAPVTLLTGAGVASGAVTHVAFVGALLSALQLFPLTATGRRERWKSALDALIVLIGGFMVLWFFALGPFLDRHGFAPAVVVTVAVYPIADLALLFSVARALLRGADGSAQRALRPLAAGALVLFAADAGYGCLLGHGQVGPRPPWLIICWLAADALLVAAAVEQGRVHPVARRVGHGHRSVRYLPYAAVAVAHGLMLAAAVREGTMFPWGGLALGATTISAVVLLRQMLVQRESDERAVTDGLTGLANRARFRETSQRSLARGARTGRHSAVLVIDLNGFKAVNDTLGHQAGDLVLVAFADALRRSVPSWGLPCRLGGDEFAVVLPDLDFVEQAYDVAGEIVATLAPVVIDGRLVPLAAGIGVAVAAPGELTHDLVVHRADLAMYRAKQLGPRTRWAVWQESFEPAAAAAA